MKTLFTALLLCLPLALAACGGDDDEGPSKAEFIEKADALCQESDKKTDAIIAESVEDPQDPQPEEAQQVIEESLPIIKGNLDDLKELEKPKDDEEEIETLFGSVETGIESLEEAGASPEASIAALTSQPFAQADKLAQDYGFKECGAND